MPGSGQASELIGRCAGSAEAKHFAMMSSATFLAQVANFAWTPFLARLYDPAAFGVLSVFVSIVSTLSLCSAFRLEQAIVLAKRRSDAVNLFSICCALVAACAVAAGLVAVICRQGTHAALIGAGILASGAYQPMLALCSRERAFGAASVAQLVRVAAVITVQAFAAGSSGLIAGYLAGEYAAGTVLALRLARLGRQGESTRPRLTEAWRLIRLHRDFPLYSAPQALLNALSQNLPAYLLAAFFGPSTAGAYWLAVRILVAPSTLAGFAFRQVYYEYACRLDRNRSALYPRLRLATVLLTSFSFVFAVGIMAAGPSLLPIIFGRKWLLAGTYVALLAPWTAAMFANLASVAIIPVVGLQRFSLVFDCVLVALRAGALVIGGLLASHVLAVSSYSAVGLAANVFLIFLVFRFVRKREASQTASVALDARYA